MRPQSLAILRYMQHRGEYVTSTEIVRNCFTTTPSKRLDELHDAGLIEKRQRGKGNQMEYCAKEAS